MTITIDWPQFDPLRDLTLGAHKACTYIQRHLLLVPVGVLGKKITP
jgi:hypothetical protein